MALTNLPAASDNPANKVPFHCFIQTTGDALRFIQAARQGIVPRSIRRLNDFERKSMIKSGAVFVFSNDESGIKRWTEGLSWSASRIVGNFLVYREVTERGSGRCGSDSYRTSPRRRGSVDCLSPSDKAGKKFDKSFGTNLGSSGRFKTGGLMKKTMTVTMKGTEHHLIAYYTQEDVDKGRLPTVASHPEIAELEIPAEILEETKFRIPPKTEVGPDGHLRYICDADEKIMSSRFPSPSSSGSRLDCMGEKIHRSLSLSDIGIIDSHQDYSAGPLSAPLALQAYGTELLPPMLRIMPTEASFSMHSDVAHGKLLPAPIITPPRSLPNIVTTGHTPTASPTSTLSTPCSAIPGGSFTLFDDLNHSPSSRSASESPLSSSANSSFWELADLTSNDVWNSNWTTMPAPEILIPPHTPITDDRTQLCGFGSFNMTHAQQQHPHHHHQQVQCQPLSTNSSLYRVCNSPQLPIGWNMA